MPATRSSTLLLLALSAYAWQTELPPGILQLSRVKTKMTRNLTRVPNYTCLETMLRGIRPPESRVIAVPGKSVPFRKYDVLRLEVAEINGDELFARAGEHEFKKMSLHDLGGGGLFGNGIFSLFTAAIFKYNAAQIHYAGEEEMEGRRLLHYEFTVPLMESGYQITTSKGTEIVGYHGSFWADPELFDAVRLDIEADGIPRYLGIDQAGNSVEYGWVRIGSSNALLPQSGVLSMRLNDGTMDRNDITFTHCREYGVESTISFEDIKEGEKPDAGKRNVELPGNLMMTLRLETPIDSKTAQAGDPISARVDAEVKHRNKIVLQSDAAVRGRIRAVEKHLEGFPYVLITLEFTEIEFEGKSARFFASFEKLLPAPGSEGLKRVPPKGPMNMTGLPATGSISATGNRLALPAGTRMLWKSLSYEQAAKIE